MTSEPEPLVIYEREDGSTYVGGPFPDRALVDSEAWVDLFDCATLLDLVAPNGDPVRYEVEDGGDDPIIFKRVSVRALA